MVNLFILNLLFIALAYIILVGINFPYLHMKMPPSVLALDHKVYDVGL